MGVLNDFYKQFYNNPYFYKGLIHIFHNFWNYHKKARLECQALITGLFHILFLHLSKVGVKIWNGLDAFIKIEKGKILIGRMYGIGIQAKSK